MLKKAYEYLENVTPLRYDCGRLCGGACCEGEGEIWLLPDEEMLFRGREDFEIKYTDGEYNLKCDADCAGERGVRPFGCRIFPYFPIVEKTDGRLKVRLMLDPRGTPFCPLANCREKCEKSFERAVRKAVRLLCTEERYYMFFKNQGELLQEIATLRQKLGLE